MLNVANVSACIMCAVVKGEYLRTQKDKILTQTFSRLTLENCIFAEQCARRVCFVVSCYAVLHIVQPQPGAVR